MKGRLLLVAVIISGLGLLCWTEPSTSATSLRSHSPILIDGNGNFTSANGVVSGNGSVSSPYIIEGWDIYVNSATYGIHVRSTSANFVIRNVYLHSGVPNYNKGIVLQSVSHARVENNTFYAQWVSLELDGSTNSTVSNNTASGVQGSIFTAGEYGIEVSNSNRILVKGNSVNGAFWGIRVDNSPQVTITGNHAFNNFFPGIFIDNSRNDYVLDNTVDHTLQDVNLSAWYSSNITFARNFASHASGGLSLLTDSFIIVDNNQAQLNDVGLSCFHSNHIIFSNNAVFSNHDGINSVNCPNNNMTRNAVFSNTHVGVYVTGISQTPTLAPAHITQNTLVLNTLGIQLDLVQGVQVNHNDMVNNTVQAIDNLPSQNAWDNGYPSGGNYWSEYRGVDHCSGSAQNICPGPDGIGDTIYGIAPSVADSYPLMSPVEPPVNADIQVLSANALETSRIQGQNETITVTVQNNGSAPESLPVTLYFNGTVIDTITTALLSSGEAQDLSFTWSTITVIPGNYSLHASAGPVPYEIHLSDNSKPGGIVRIIADTVPPSWTTGSRLGAQNITMTGLTLIWTRASDDAVVLEYKVYKGPDLLASLPATNLSFNVAGLYPGTKYTFTIEAGDAGNNWSSDGPRLTVSTISDTTPPIWASSSTLTSRNISPDSLMLTWTPTPTDNFLVSSYRIYQGSSVIATIPALSEDYQVGGLKPNSTYSFKVEASDPSNNWSTDGPSTTGTTMPNPSVEIIIRERPYNSYYDPPAVTIGVGETVEWFNTSPFPETVVSCSPGGSADPNGCPVLNDASLPSFLRFIGPNQAFYFQFPIAGTYHYYDLYDTSARGTVTVVSFIPRGFLYVNATYEGLPNQGSDLTITANLHNDGNVQIQVTEIREVSDIGNYNFTTGVPLDLNPGETKTVSIPFHIPLSTGIGNHTITFTIQWEYYDPNALQWVGQTPIVLQGQFLIHQASTPPDFSLSAGPSAVHVSRGSTGTTNITITRSGGFSGTITLSSAPSSTSLICSFSPAKLTAGDSDNSTLSCNGTPGAYTVVITADGVYVSHTLSVTFDIATATPPPDFTISSDSAVTFQMTFSGKATITLTALYGFSSNINLELNPPSGLTCSLDKSSISGSGSTTMTCSGQPGTYTVTIKATSGSTTHTTQTTVYVKGASTSNQRSSNLPMNYLYAAVGVGIIISALATMIFLRRKTSSSSQAPAPPVPQT